MQQIQMGDGPAVWCLPGAASEWRFVYREIFLEHVYLRHGITIQEGDCLVDVGANAGMFSLFAMQSATQLELFAFEPVPPIFSLLEKNLAPQAEAGRHRLHLMDCGLSDSVGEREVVYFPAAPANSTCYVSDKQAEADLISGETRLSDVWNYSKLSWLGMVLLHPSIRKWLVRKHMNRIYQKQTSYTVPFETLDSIIAEHQIRQIDLLKIDVEGSEFDVLKGLSEDNWSRVQQLVVEISPVHRHRLLDLQEELKQRGFQKINTETTGYDRFVPEAGTPSLLYAIREPR